ncbi:hypothetical protein CHISP_0412 [Chitinispirillum alkaliphilum]|nr:hypothetical protein CHISP_0412 [Chitinispirillum alkaliphilum]
MKIFLLLIALFTAPLHLTAQPQTGSVNVGVLFMFGARHDNIRMCVASPGGVKIGPVGDIMLTIRYGVRDNIAIGADVPVMRPLLFGAAFRMLQFEPQFVLDWKSPRENVDLITSLTLGPSFHYGPDYQSDNSNRSPSFFAWGPNVGIRLGVGFGESYNPRNNIVALRPFYTALFAPDYRNGRVLGGAFEYLRTF